MSKSASNYPSGTARTEAFTDGVFAIAATLLVLDLTATTITGIHTDSDLWMALADRWSNFSAFVISFALLAGLWMIHLRQFRDITGVDATLLWLNNARLLFIVLIPFTTMLSAEYSELLAGRILLPINFFFAALLGYLSWRWAAARGGHLMRPDAYAQRVRAGTGGLAAVACAALAVALSPWLGSWAFAAFLVNGPLSILFLRIAAGRGRATPPQ